MVSSNKFRIRSKAVCHHAQPRCALEPIGFCFVSWALSEALDWVREVGGVEWGGWVFFFVIFPEIGIWFASGLDLGQHAVRIPSPDPDGSFLVHQKLSSISKRVSPPKRFQMG